MKVKLISYSQAAVDEDSFDGENTPKDIEQLIAFCARVSNPSNQMNLETSSKLVSYLAKHKHWSPFEMTSACLEITTTRDISRQFLRHKSIPVQEFSQRYADPVKELEFVLREARMQDHKNRQNSIETVDEILQKEWERRQQQVIDIATENYQWAVANGIAKEQARVVLPEGNTVTRLYGNGTIRSWIHYCEVRTDISTQKEHRVLAKAVADTVAKVFPSINQFIQQ